jgi:hypothetical protein
MRTTRAAAAGAVTVSLLTALAARGGGSSTSGGSNRDRLKAGSRRPQHRRHLERLLAPYFAGR